jgi:hypothetical protein
MTNDDWMRWDHPQPPTPSAPVPGEQLFAMTRGVERLTCRVLYHGSYGYEAQFLLEVRCGLGIGSRRKSLRSCGPTKRRRSTERRGGPTMSEQPDVYVYINYMAHARDRVNFILANMRGNAITGNHHWDVEVLFFHFRRVLELIAFSSLAANLDVYAAAQKKYHEHYNARLLLRDVEKVNPNFYPDPIALERQGPTNVKVTRLTDGFLTRDEFLKLYEIASTVLHTPNPWSQKESKIEFGYTVEEWARRIQRLLAIHTITLVGNTQRWLIEVPDKGIPHLAVATPFVASA